MTGNQNAPAATLCRKCHQPIEIRSEDECLDKFGNFFRLRCSTPECGHEDWYKELRLFQHEAVAPTADGPGEVWIHDVILGLSFRAESAPQNMVPDAREMQL